MNLYEKIDINDYKILFDKDDNDGNMYYCPECGANTTFKKTKWYEEKYKGIKEFKPNIHAFHSMPINVEYRDINEINEKTREFERAATINNIFDYRNNTESNRNTGGIKKYGQGNILIQEYECCVNNRHKKYDIYYLSSSKIIKIGQYPSEYDTRSNEYLDKLKVVCGRKDAKEIAKFVDKALIMESSGLGIPALVYMRRSFERLIAISEDKNNLENTGTTMAERIKNNPLLPELIKDNVRLYNIISEGIHNETEEECMELFKLIKSGFTILLRKTYEHVQEQKELDELSKLISRK